MAVTVIWALFKGPTASSSGPHGMLLGYLFDHHRLYAQQIERDIQYLREMINNSSCSFNSELI